MNDEGCPGGMALTGFSVVSAPSREEAEAEAKALASAEPRPDDDG